MNVRRKPARRAPAVAFALLLAWEGAVCAAQTATAGSTSEAAPFLVRSSVYVFGRASFVTGLSPVAIAHCDLDGDGIDDVVTVDGGDDTVSVLLGTHGGGFRDAVAYDTGTQPNALAVEDLDADGALDLAVVNQNCPVGTCGRGSVSVLLGNGDGTFQSEVPYDTDTNPQSVTTGDFNEDTIPDLAVVNAVTIITQGPGTVTILLGNGDGTFAPGTEFPAGQGPSAIVSRDFDHDDHLDLAIVNFIGFTVAHAVALLEGNGDGSFQAPVTFETANGPVDVVAADFDGNGDLDLATADLGANAVSILMGNGNGTFQTHVDVPAGFGPTAITVADLDADDRLDLALTTFTFSGGGGSVVILPGNGNGTFGPFAEYDTGPIGPAIVAGDVDGDGRQDLVVSDQTRHVTVLLGKGNGTLVSPASYATGSVPVSLATTDFNGDARNDLVVANNDGGSVSLLLGNANGTFQPKVDFAAGATPTCIAAADFDQDGEADLAVSNGNPSTVSILLGLGDGTFLPKVAFATGADPASLVVADFNADSRSDIAAADRGANRVSILLGNGDGTFQSKLDFNAGPGPASLARADFNRDGKLDLAVADVNTGSFGPGKVAVLAGNGSGSFGAPASFDAGVQAEAVTAGDWNGDGKADLAVATNLDVHGSVNVLLGNGNGTFQPQVSYATGRISVSVTAADWNGDGRRDLAVVNQGSNTVTILEGAGDGTFELQAHYAAGFLPSAVTPGDFNKDGRLDMAVTNLTGTLTVFVSGQ